ncbi:hypothetical protein IT409_00390 [Candidatus Falkowbacteria bacterium]|nr:hypothetical protein [Candidatus Falkowbacteria bacterium]
MNFHVRRNTGVATYTTNDARIVLLQRAFLIFGCIMIAKLFFFQVVHADFYNALASDQHEIYKTLFPSRGEIFVHDTSSLTGDDALYSIATNKEYSTIYAQPRFITDPQKVADTLAPVLGVLPPELMSKLDKPQDPYEVLIRKVEDDVVDRVMALGIEGIKVQKETYRFYPEGDITSALTGFVSAADNKKVGQYSLEGYFNEELTGVAGALRSEKDVSGRWISSTAKSFKPAVDGSDIILTIDKNIQYFTCSTLYKRAEEYQATSATAIVADPFTGKIMAMCSYPTYDPNEYSKVEDIRAYNNTAIYEAYEPGSIFKPITMAAALDMGAVTPSTTYIDNGEVKIDRFTIRNSDKKAHGKVDMVEVLNQSLNLGMIFTVQQLGVSNFKQYLENFGFGKKTGIMMNTESAGNISSLEKKGDIYSFTASFGQGITVTPLQMIQALSVLANGGYLIKPYVVEKVITNGNETVYESKAQKRVLDEKTSTLIGGMMGSVIKYGFGQKAQVPGYSIAGKTGTAQIPDFERGGYSTKVNHSFVGYGPIDNPAFVMIVKFEDPKNAGNFAESTAAPTFGEIAKDVLHYLRIPTDQ